jgi:phage-related protein
VSRDNDNKESDFKDDDEILDEKELKVKKEEVRKTIDVGLSINQRSYLTYKIQFTGGALYVCCT